MTVKRRFVSLWFLAVIAATVAFVVHLSLRFEIIELGYEISQAHDEQRRLVQDKHLLTLEAATLRQAGRIEAVARHSLHMTSPISSQVVQIRKTSVDTPVSGSVR